MRRPFLFSLIAAGMMLASPSRTAFAVCTQNDTVHPIFQCGYKSYFAPKPAGAGKVSGVWWQLGYGNREVSTGFAGTSLEGTGFGPAGTFSGNDSGKFDMVFTDAKSVLPKYAAQIPEGALCLNYENTWGGPGVDGCADNPRTAEGEDNDNILNRYFSSYGEGYFSDKFLVDYPMGMLVTESTGKHFAVAFLASRERGKGEKERASDVTEGHFDMGAISNGSPNPIDGGKKNVVPWQEIPQPKVDASGGATEGVTVSWTPAVAISDESKRKSGRPLNNPGNGVGVLDQGPLIRYIVEGTLSKGGKWSVLAETTDSSASVKVSGPTVIRLRTVFGKKPATKDLTLQAAREGRLGDLGYEVVSGEVTLEPGKKSDQAK